MQPLELEKLSDQELMAKLAKDDLGSWSELVKRYSKLVYSITNQILKNNEDTEDALQNTFVSLKFYAGKFDVNQPLKPWLARIASVEAIRIYNKNKNTSKKESVRMDTTKEPLPSPKKGVVEIAEQIEIELLVKKAIDSLPEVSRLAVTMYYAGGMNQMEIAYELGLSQNSISEKIKSSLEKVKAYLKKAGIQSAIVISPALVQESILSIVPPNELISKVTKKLPTEGQIASVTIKSARLATQAAAKKSSFVWMLTLLGTIGIVVIGYLYWQDKAKETPQKIVSGNPVKYPLKQTNIFQPIDYTNHENFNVTQEIVVRENSNKSGESEYVQYTKTEKIWNIINNGPNLVSIIKNTIKENTREGIYINKNFDKAYAFNSTIKIISENNEFGFVLKTPINNFVTAPNQKALDKSKISEGQYTTFGIVKSQRSCTVNIKFYIWPFNGKWNIATIIKVKGDEGFDTYTYNNLGINKQLFQIGFYSDGKTEVSKFEYKTLDENWSPRSEPDLKKALNKIPEEFLPK